jgi:hypothetical protein
MRRWFLWQYVRFRFDCCSPSVCAAGDFVIQSDNVIQRVLHTFFCFASAPAISFWLDQAHVSVFSCACSLIRPHCLGCPFPSPHLKALGSATQGQARDRDLRAALGKPQDKVQLRQTLFRKECQVPESQVAPPDKFNLPRRLSPPSHGSADRRLRPVHVSA